MREHLSAASAKLAARVGVTCAVALLAGIACQAAAPAASPSPGASAFPLVIHESGGASVALDHQPHRIVSLSPTATEMLFAIGAGKQVVAVDDQSTYPSAAPVTKLSGFQPNVEAIAGYAPDLVVAAEDTGGLVAGLTALKVPTLIEPAAKDLNGTYAQLRELGTATGQRGAGSLISKIQSDVAAIVASVSKPARRITVYHELDDTYYSATSRTFIGQVYTLLGIQNIADRATGAAPDYPQLSSEFVVSANPDLIVLADSKCCKQTLQTVAARPGWGAIAAVKGGQVVGVDDDIASHWGPRIVDFMRQVAPHVSQLERQAA
jgi:iron complex transport system substrate-binding protein